MIVFDIKKPLILKELNEEITLRKKEINKKYSKIFNYGLVSLAIGLCVLSLFGLNINRTNDPYGFNLILYTSWLFFTTFLIITPLILKSHVLELMAFPYQEAHLEKIHDCLAFISMPGMEKYKEYVENVAKQGRNLTHFECDKIIKYWKGLAHK